MGYVPFSSETLVSGKLFEDIRDSVHKTADPSKYDAIIVKFMCPNSIWCSIKVTSKGNKWCKNYWY